MIGEGQRGATLESLLTKLKMRKRNLNEIILLLKVIDMIDFSTTTNCWYVSNISKY